MAQAVTDVSLLESCVRTVLNLTAPRAMAVLEPLKITIENFPSDSVIEIEVPNFPTDESKGTHKVPFDRVVYIDSVDFQEVFFFLHFFFQIIADPIIETAFC
jgi:glutaminyl-tRNA synthetase